MKILVLEDQPFVRRQLVRMLSRAGYDDIVCAAALKDAVRLSAELIIADVTLPDADALEAVAAVKKSCGGAVIALSSAELGLGEELIAAAGADAVVTKPFAERRLIAKIKDFEK